MKIDFVWQGINGRYGKWQDGLYGAMKIIERDHTVRYLDITDLSIAESDPADVVLYWEAPCTILSPEHGAGYLRVLNLPTKRALLFAGGQIQRPWVADWDMIFVESELNEKELTEMELPWRRAFGVNTQIFKPERQPKIFDGFMQATFAGWKRHGLFAEALGSSGIACGRIQPTDMWGYNHCKEKGVATLDELPAHAVNTLANMSYAVVNTAEYWGGGQRCTLEAMAAGVPVIVMEDSPKNSEYVLESGAGSVVKPEPQAIREEIMRYKHLQAPTGGVEYIQSKWTEQHYANALLAGIKDIL